MGIRPASFENLVRALARFPALGPKSAARIGLWLLKQPKEKASEIATVIIEAREALVPCRDCFLYSENPLCPVCADSRRDRTTICVVAETEDAWRLEETGDYGGLYHILGGLLSPLDGVGIEDLTIGRLVDRIRGGGFREVILATDFDTEGNATAAYIAETLAGRDVRVTRLAYGLPVGAELVYTDDATLSHALAGRRQIDSEKNQGTPR